MENKVADLKEVIKSTINSINQGIKDSEYDIPQCIDFELAVVSIEEGAGKVKLYVAGLNGKLSKEEISKIKFTIPRRSTWSGAAV